jgi:hypothetical protein
VFQEVIQAVRLEKLAAGTGCEEAEEVKEVKEVKEKGSCR